MWVSKLSRENVIYYAMVILMNHRRKLRNAIVLQKPKSHRGPANKVIPFYEFTWTKLSYLKEKKNV